MCDPVTLTVIAVAGTAASILQNQQQAQAANEYEEALYGQRKEAAVETFAALRERELQERAKASQDVQQVTTLARQASSAAKLQALESGTAGVSVGLLLDQFERQQLSNISVIRSNLGATTRQIRAQERAAGRLQGPATTLGPLDTPLGIVTSGLQVAGAGLQAHQLGKGTQAPK